ncbi:MAG: Asp-tRNA(Asn)/Glu-tRNA(Gln) amidotransferase subunit GatC [Candidatus Omnitrophica bacterium]|nr:Asp-tRNA(Asn)/Glu-tRNA(Gln) amidotransferase subunit GatC [Candidatus Omnitrophota bacterium]
MIDKKTVEYVANLARMELDAKELDMLARQLEDILRFIDKLKKVDVSEVKPSSHILPLANVFREDTVKESLPQEEALKNTVFKKGGLFVVPRIIEE